MTDDFKLDLSCMQYKPTMKKIVDYYKHMGLVGEEKTAILQTLLAIKRQHFGIEALSGSGKSASMDILANHNKLGDSILLPKRKVYIMGLSSKTAAMYNQESINEADLIYVEELQKLGTSLEMTEFLKNLAEGKDVTRDVRDQANRENLKLKINKGKGIMYTLALENTHKNDIEMKRRFITLSTDVSKTQTKNVISRKAQERFNRDALNVLEDKELLNLKSHISECIEYGKSPNLKYENPFAEYISKFIPMPDQKARSFCDHYFNLVEASCLFNHKNRVSFTTGNKRLTKHLLVNIEDIIVIQELYSDTFNRDIHGVPPLGMEILKVFDLIDYAKTIHVQKGLNEYNPTDNKKKWVTVADIHDALKEKFNIVLSHKVTKDTCDALYDAGYLIKNSGGANMSEYTISDKIADFKTSIDWIECLNEGINKIKDVFPDKYDEWIASQSKDNKIIWHHPITDDIITVHQLASQIKEIKENQKFNENMYLKGVYDKIKEKLPINYSDVEKHMTATDANKLIEMGLIAIDPIKATLVLCEENNGPNK